MTSRLRGVWSTAVLQPRTGMSDNFGIPGAASVGLEIDVAYSVEAM